MSALRIIDGRGYTLRTFNLATFDLDDPQMRAVLFSAVMSVIADEPDAEAVELSDEGEAVDLLMLTNYLFDSRAGVRAFGRELFEGIDDMAPPPRSGPRAAYRPSRRAR